MTERDAERMLELEESADGVELFRPPGEQLHVEEARDQAEASGWIPTREHHAAGSRSPGRAASRSSLDRAISRLEMVVDRPTAEPGWLEAVDSALAELEQALDQHIREAESADGYLAEIVDGEPRLSAQVDAMKREHAELSSSLRQIRLTLSHESANPRAVRRAISVLLGQLLIHRQASSDLVFEAYNTDIAAND